MGGKGEGLASRLGARISSCGQGGPAVALRVRGPTWDPSLGGQT